MRNLPKKWLKWILQGLVLALILWGVRRTVLQAVEDLQGYSWQARYEWLALSGLLYLLGYLPAGWFWHRVLIRLGQRPPLLQTLRAYYIGHLGKYVPGKALVVVLRAGLLKGSGVEIAAASVGVFAETLTMMAVGSFLAALVIALQFSEHLWIVLVAIGLMILTGLPTLPPFFARLARLAGLGKIPEATLERLRYLDWTTLAGGWISIAAGWVCLAWSLWAVLRGLGVANLHPWSDLPVLLGCVTISVVAGFVSLVPGGLVIRELFLLELLTSSGVSEAQALVAATVARLVWLVAEVVLSGILYTMRPPTLREITTAEPPPSRS